MAPSGSATPFRAMLDGDRPEAGFGAIWTVLSQRRGPAISARLYTFDMGGAPTGECEPLDETARNSGAC
jgi:hypothetical protein